MLGRKRRESIRSIRCRPEMSGYEPGLLKLDASGEIFLLELCVGVRRVGLVHACSECNRMNNSCSVYNDRGTINHGKLLISEGTYYYYTRR